MRLGNRMLLLTRSDAESLRLAGGKFEHTTAHLSWNFRQAKRMVEISRELRFPMLAGSSVPVARRIPADRRTLRRSLPARCRDLL